MLLRSKISILILCLATFFFGTKASYAGGCVKLTFDDGPHATLTPKLLAILAKENVRATFYILGRSAKSMPGIVRSINAGGHEIGNHSWSHPRLSTGNVRLQIGNTDAAIKAIVGFAPATLRAPYGALSKGVAGMMNRPFVSWDVDTLDWRYRNPERIARVAISGARSGAIILMHDTHATTIAAVPAIIKGLKARGFSFCTVSG
jgi:peptidoglycan-N-acetylglucosamine deacetylase